eukprot:2765955-Prymnesium_polylepis.1
MGKTPALSPGPQPASESGWNEMKQCSEEKTAMIGGTKLQPVPPKNPCGTGTHPGRAAAGRRR